MLDDGAVEARAEVGGVWLQAADYLGRISDAVGRVAGIDALRREGEEEVLASVQAGCLGVAGGSPRASCPGRSCSRGSTSWPRRRLAATDSVAA